jgi:hypothetical protein
MNLKLKVILIFFSFNSVFIYGAEKYNWQRFSGKWEIQNSRLIESNATAAPWNYYELLNNNSIISIHPYNDYSTFNYKMEIFDRVNSPAEVSASFNITSDDRQWYYHIYAFKFTGGFWGINNVSLIHSDRADKSKPFSAKNNTFIKIINTADLKLSYGKEYDCRIEFEDNKVSLFINNKIAISGILPSANHNGRVAFSTKNVKLAIDDVEIKQQDKIIFKDDFSVNSIYVKMLKAKKETE